MTISEQLDEFNGLVETMRIDVLLGYHPTPADRDWLVQCHMGIDTLSELVEAGRGGEVLDTPLTGQCEWLDHLLRQTGRSL